MKPKVDFGDIEKIWAKIKELDGSIAALSTGLKEVSRTVREASKTEKKERWRAEKNEPYFAVEITPGCIFGNGLAQVVSLYDYRNPKDYANYKSGNYFQTEHDAIVIADEIDMIFDRIRNA